MGLDAALAVVVGLMILIAGVELFKIGIRRARARGESLWVWVGTLILILLLIVVASKVKHRYGHRSVEMLLVYLVWASCALAVWRVDRATKQNNVK